MAGTMSSSASNTTTEIGSQESLKRNSSDVGWEYGMLVDSKKLQRIKCKLCGHVMSGGIHRLKQHIAQIKGQVASCKKASAEAQALCNNALNESKGKKMQKLEHEEGVRQEVVILEGSLGTDYDEASGGKRKPHSLGPMDKFANRIDPEVALSGSKNTRQQNINDALFKERTHSVHQYLARWVYEAGIPFHVIDNDSFKRFVEAVGQFGPGYRPPSQYMLREPLLKEEVERTKSMLKTQEEEWALNGCSIMTDAWSDRKRRSIMNLCVNCKEGTTFLSSKEASNESHTGEYIFEYVDNCVEIVGPQNVVQVVTDNASNNMAAALLMKKKRENIFWTSCATHTLNLMLQGIGNLPRFKGVIEKAKSFTIYIYAHHKTLALMRKYTKRRDIVRPGVTRFATAFLTLQSLMEKKNELRAMITSSEWSETKHAKSVKGKAAVNIALSASFWNGVSLCLKVFAPLVKVLRIVDGDRKPSMGFVYGELSRAREEIKKVFKDQEAHYRPIINIIDAKAEGRLDSSLHVAAYLLNPYYIYSNPSIGNDPVVISGFLSCVEMIFPDVETQNLVSNTELHKYLKKEGLFGRNVAIAGCKQNDDAYDPVFWWNLYGNNVPTLQKMEKRILALTTSSSGCERNWSAFEGIHTKKRNRLDTTRLNNLVYVQFNARLLNKKRREKEKNVDVLISSEATMAQGWIVDGGDDDLIDVVDGSEMIEEELGVDGGLEPRRSSRIQEIRELHEDDFISDEEEENDEMSFEFESDSEGVQQDGYGEDEFDA